MGIVDLAVYPDRCVSTTLVLCQISKKVFDFVVFIMNLMVLSRFSHPLVSDHTNSFWRLILVLLAAL